MLPDDPMVRQLIAAAIALLLVIGLGTAFWRERSKRRIRKSRYRIRTRKPKFEPSGSPE